MLKDIVRFSQVMKDVAIESGIDFIQNKPECFWVIKVFIKLFVMKLKYRYSLLNMRNLAKNKHSPTIMINKYLKSQFSFSPQLYYLYY